MAKYTCDFKHNIYYNISQNLTKEFTLHSAEAYSEPCQTSEAVVWRCSAKKMFLEISENSQENTCGFLKRETLRQVLSCEFSIRIF